MWFFPKTHLDTILGYKFIFWAKYVSIINKWIEMYIELKTFQNVRYGAYFYIGCICVTNTNTVIQIVNAFQISNEIFISSFISSIVKRREK